MRSRTTTDGGTAATKTWGPFTGRQLTTIICVLALTVLFPVAAWSTVSGSSVFVTDPTTGHRAAVGSAGSLHTSVSGGTLTVNGTVVATPPAPGSTFAMNSFTGNAGCTSFSAPAGKAMVVTSITLSIYNAAFPTGPSIKVGPPGCGGTTTGILLPQVSEAGVTTIPFPSGIAIRNSHALEISTGTMFVDTVVNGYFVPSSACASGCL